MYIETTYNFLSYCTCKLHMLLSTTCKRKYFHLFNKKDIEGLIEGTPAGPCWKQNRAFDVEVNLKPGVEGQHAVSKTDLSVGSWTCNNSQLI